MIPSESRASSATGGPRYFGGHCHCVSSDRQCDVQRERQTGSISVRRIQSLTESSTVPHSCCYAARSVKPWTFSAPQPFATPTTHQSLLDTRMRSTKRGTSQLQEMGIGERWCSTSRCFKPGTDKEWRNTRLKLMPLRFAAFAAPSLCGRRIQTPASILATLCSRWAKSTMQSTNCCWSPGIRDGAGAPFKK